jgi:septum formation protein
MSSLPIILASTSPTRKQLLTNAAVPHVAMPANLDEGSEKKKLHHLKASLWAPELARAKALSLAQHNAGSLIIGCDQTLIFNSRVISKPDSIAEAKHQLQQLRGTAHMLHTAIACVRNRTVVWQYAEPASLTMRNFTDEFLDNYLASEQPHLLATPGSYRIEGKGLQLFETITGEHTTILGLPLLPLLVFLRAEGYLAS